MVSCLGLRSDDSMVVICANWSMTYWSTEQRWETALGLVTEHCIVVSDCMLISILSVSVESLELLCAEAADVLAPWGEDLKPDVAHFGRQLAAVGTLFPQAFLPGLVLKVFFGLVIQLIVVHNCLLI